MNITISISSALSLFIIATQNNGAQKTILGILHHLWKLDKT